MQDGLLPAAPAKRLSYKVFLEKAFPVLRDISVVGAGHGAMRRDRHNIFNTSTYGKVDIYARTAEYPALTKVTRTATRDITDSSLLRLSFTASPTDFPALYFIERILPSGSEEWTGTLEKVSETKSFDQTAVPDSSPYIATAEEAVYSAYQTVVVSFKDPAARLKENSELTYDVYVRWMPYIFEMQQYAGGSNFLPPGCDVLVKAPIPCMVGMDIKIVYKDGHLDPEDSTTLAAFKNAAVTAVNSTTFAEPRLHVSKIIDAIHDVLDGDGYVDTPLTMRGVIYAPDGSNIVVSSDESLIIPTNDEMMVSRDTVAFYMLPGDISITFEVMQ